MDKPTPHKHADHILERARQEATGELQAGWWQWYYKGHPVCPDGWMPSHTIVFAGDEEFRYVKTDKHPDYDPHEQIRAEWEKVKGKGTCELWVRLKNFEKFIRVNNSENLGWSKFSQFEIRPVKPKLKLIDWSKVPRGVMTNYGTFTAVDDVYGYTLHRDGMRIGKTCLSNLRLAPADEQQWIRFDQQQWDELDSPEWGASFIPTDINVGLLRLRGLAIGYTDNPELAA